MLSGSSGGVMVKPLACGARGRGSIPGLAATISDIGYLLPSSRNMAEIQLKRRKSSIDTNQLTNQPTKTYFPTVLSQRVEGGGG